MYIPIFSFLLVAAVFAIIILVTELNKRKEALVILRGENDSNRREVALLKDALDKMDILYLAHDMEGTITSINKRAEQFFHFSPDDVGRRKLTDFFSSEGQPGWENHIKSILQKEDSQGRFQLQMDSGEEIELRYISVLNVIEEIPVTIHILAQPEEVILQNKWLDILPLPCFLADDAGEIISATHDKTESSPDEFNTLRNLKEVLDSKNLKEYSAFCAGRVKERILKLSGVGPAASGNGQKYSFWVRCIGDGLSLICAFPEIPHEQKAASSAEFSEEQLHNLHGYISAILGFTQIMAEDLTEKKMESPYLSDILTASKHALKILDIIEPEERTVPVADETLEEGERSLILLVDDDSVLIRMNTIFIEQLGFKVISANSGEQALNLFKENKNKIGMVISDIRIPDFSGYTLAQKIYSIQADLPVVLISGQLEDEQVHSDNILRVLLKPVMPNLLKQVIFEGLKS